MKKGIFKRIGLGILNGFPLVQSVVNSIKSTPPVVDAENSATNATPDKKVDSITLIAEIATVGLIMAFLMGKITMEDLMKLVQLF